MSGGHEDARWFGPDAKVLATGARGDGRHFVVRASVGGRDVVVKLYGRKRSVTRDALRDVGQRLFVGKSGVRAARRAANERRVLALWRREGFDVPGLLTDVPVPRELTQPAVVMEFVAGRPLDEVVADRALACAAKATVLARLAGEWAVRHARAVALREPALLQVHAGLDHVLHVPAQDGRPERLVTFDFEVSWTRRGAFDRRIATELAHQMKSLERCAAAAELEALLAAIRAGYGAGVTAAPLARSAAN